MTITSQPQDGDAIVEVRKDGLGNTLFVATEQFSRFLDDLVNQFTYNTTDTNQSSALSHENEGLIQSLVVSLSKAGTKTEGQGREIADLLSAISDQAIEITRLKSQLNNALSLIESLSGELSSLSVTQRQIQNDVKRVENLCQ